MIESPNGLPYARTSWITRRGVCVDERSELATLFPFGCIFLVRQAWRLTCEVKVLCKRTKAFKKGSIPTVTPMGKLLDEGNCGEVANRGEEACECVGKPIEKRRRPHSRQNCEVTDRNLIQGRCGQASGPSITKPFSFIWIGKSSAFAVKVNRLILGGLGSRSGSRLYAESRRLMVQAIGRRQQSAEAVVGKPWGPWARRDNAQGLRTMSSRQLENGSTTALGWDVSAWSGPSKDHPKRRWR